MFCNLVSFQIEDSKMFIGFQRVMQPVVRKYLSKVQISVGVEGDNREKEKCYCSAYSSKYKFFFYPCLLKIEYPQNWQ